jgi:hypothetical protein
MFGIDDPGIWLAYVLALLCLAFSLWYGISRWNKQDKDES